MQGRIDFTSDATQAEAQIARLTAQINTLKDAIANVNRSQFGGGGAGSTAFIANLTAQLKENEAALAVLTRTRSEATRVLHAYAGEFGTATQREIDHAARLGVSVQRTKDAIAATTSHSAVIANHSQRQKELEAAFQSLINVQQRSAGVAREGLAPFQMMVDRIRGHGTELRNTEQAITTYTRRTKEAAIETQGFFAAFMRGGRTPISLFDELARGQRGAAVSTLGASFRAAGTGGAFLGVGIGAAAGIGATEAIVRGAEAMGRWATETKAAAQAAGIALPQFSQLQGALALMGLKGESANATMRQFARNLATAVADPISKQAQAFHALGISQDELTHSGGDSLAMFLRFADAWASTADSANKVRAGEELLGRALEHAIPLLDKGASGVKAYMAEAQRLGITLTEETARGLIETGNKAEELSNKIRGQAIQSFIAWKSEINSVLNGLMRAIEIIGSLSQKLHELKTSIESLPGGKQLFSALPRALFPAIRLWDIYQAYQSSGSSARGPVVASAGFAPGGPPTAEESALLSEIRRRESGGDYTKLHATGQTVRSLEEVEAVKGLKSHAFGAYGFQPGTYREMGAATGRYDLSPESQDINALALNRKYGPNASQSWEKSGPYTTGATAGPMRLDVLTRNFNREMELLRAKTTLRERQFDLEIAQAKGSLDGTAKIDSQKQAFANQQIAQEKKLWEAYVDQYSQETWHKTSAEMVRLKPSEQPPEFRELWTKMLQAQEQFTSIQIRGQELTNRTAMERFQLGERGYQSETRTGADQIRMAGLRADITTAGRGPAERMAAIRAEYMTLKDVSTEQEKQLHNQMEMATAMNDDVLKTRVWFQEWDLGVSIQTKSLELMKKMSDESKKLAETWAGPLKTAFDKVGSSIEGALKGLLLAQTASERASAWKNLYSGIAGAGIDLVGSLASKGAAAALGAKEGQGLGDYIGSKIIQAIMGDPAKTAQILLLEEIAANTGAAVGIQASTSGTSALSAAGSTGGLFSGISSLFKWLGPAAVAARGGWDVPSYAGGGWSVPEGLAQLHPREMVLPENLAQGVRNSVASGGGGGAPNISLHFNGPADAAGVDRWFKDTLSRNSGAFTRLLSSGAVTPRSISAGR